MGTNDNCGMAVFKWLATVLSFAIALPAAFDNNTQIAFILTACVFIFCKFVDNVEGIANYRTKLHTFICMTGSFIGGIAIGFCFYYFAAIANVTQITNTFTTDTKVLDTVKLESNANMITYPLFTDETFLNILFLTLIFYVVEETILCGCVFCKYYNTKNKILSYKKGKDSLLDIQINE